MKEISGKAKGLGVIFVLFVVLVVSGILTIVAVVPYDTGVLTGTNLSGNQQYGGTVTSTNDYVFFVSGSDVARQDLNTGETKSVYTGDVSYLNPYDGWLYFVENGQIMRTAYYGSMTEPVGTTQNVQATSVNGLWIYYTDGDGALHKMRSDGQKHSVLTDGSVKVTAFESANRIVLFTDGVNVYRMKTDGAGREVLVTGTDITRMVYTLDDLFYCDGGVIHRVKSVEAGQSDGSSFTPVTAEIFTYTTDSDNRGNLYYFEGDTLHLRKLQSMVHTTEEDTVLCTLKNPKDIYYVGGILYVHDQSGSLFRIQMAGEQAEIKEIS